MASRAGKFEVHTSGAVTFDVADPLVPCTCPDGRFFVYRDSVFSDAKGTVPAKYFEPWLDSGQLQDPSLLWLPDRGKEDKYAFRRVEYRHLMQFACGGFHVAVLYKLEATHFRFGLALNSMWYTPLGDGASRSPTLLFTVDEKEALGHVVENWDDCISCFLTYVATDNLLHRGESCVGHPVVDQAVVFFAMQIGADRFRAMFDTGTLQKRSDLWNSLVYAGLLPFRTPDSPQSARVASPSNMCVEVEPDQDAEDSDIMVPPESGNRLMGIEGWREMLAHVKTIKDNEAFGKAMVVLMAYISDPAAPPEVKLAVPKLKDAVLPESKWILRTKKDKVILAISAVIEALEEKHKNVTLDMEIEQGGSENGESAADGRPAADDDPFVAHLDTKLKILDKSACIEMQALELGAMCDTYSDPLPDLLETLRLTLTGRTPLSPPDRSQLADFISSALEDPRWSEVVSEGMERMGTSDKGAYVDMVRTSEQQLGRSELLFLSSIMPSVCFVVLHRHRYEEIQNGELSERTDDDRFKGLQAVVVAVDKQNRYRHLRPVDMTGPDRIYKSLLGHRRIFEDFVDLMQGISPLQRDMVHCRFMRLRAHDVHHVARHFCVAWNAVRAMAQDRVSVEYKGAQYTGTECDGTPGGRDFLVQHDYVDLALKDMFEEPYEPHSYRYKKREAVKLDVDPGLLAEALVCFLEKQVENLSLQDYDVMECFKFLFVGKGLADALFGTVAFDFDWQQPISNTVMLAIAESIIEGVGVLRQSLEEKTSEKKRKGENGNAIVRCPDNKLACIAVRTLNAARTMLQANLDVDENTLSVCMMFQRVQASTTGLKITLEALLKAEDPNSVLESLGGDAKKYSTLEYVYFL